MCDLGSNTDHSGPGHTFDSDQLSWYGDGAIPAPHAATTMYLANSRSDELQPFTMQTDMAWANVLFLQTQSAESAWHPTDLAVSPRQVRAHSGR